jgi:hypothetical protein
LQTNAKLERSDQSASKEERNTLIILAKEATST